MPAFDHPSRVEQHRRLAQDFLGDRDRALVAGHRDLHFAVSSTVGDLVGNPVMGSTLALVADQLDRPRGEVGAHRDSSGWPLAWMLRKLISVGALPRYFVTFDHHQILLPPRVEAALSRLFATLADAVTEFNVEMTAIGDSYAAEPPPSLSHDERQDFLRPHQNEMES